MACAKGDQTVRDIRNALSWLNRHIASFNGDPANVTVFGQSAGGASADVLLQTKADHVLFQNVILMSGMLPVCGIYTEEEYEVIYNKLLRICDIDTNLPPAQRLAALRRIPSDYLSACTSPLQNGVSVAAFSPCDDGFLLGEGKRIPRLCEYPSLRYDFKGRIMMGDCRRKSRMPPLHSFAEMRNYITILIDEGIIFMPELVQEKLCTYELIAMIDKHLPEEIVSDTLSQYAITEHMTSEEHFLAAEALVSDIAFFAPAYYSANNHRSNNFFVYHWDHCSECMCDDSRGENQANICLGTGDNAWGRGKFAHHSMDYMFAFGSYACCSFFMSADRYAGQGVCEMSLARRKPNLAKQLALITYGLQMERIRTYLTQQTTLPGCMVRELAFKWSTHRERVGQWHGSKRYDLIFKHSMCEHRETIRPAYG